MFSKEDYREYLEELQEIYKENLRIYTDLLNELDDKALRNRFFVMAGEDMKSFDFLESVKEQYF